MNKQDFNIIESKIFSLSYEGLSVFEFEQWVYATPELQTLLKPDDYLSLISLDFKCKHTCIEIDKILGKYIDYGKFETIKVIALLDKALNNDKNIGEILREFYDMYCHGYYFFEDLGLGYGLSCEVPIKYADTWEELNISQKSEIINSFYPQIESDLVRARDWIENKKIILTGVKNDMNHWEYIDNRTPDEKKSTVWFEVKSNPEHSIKQNRSSMKKLKKWWEFWK